MKEKTEKQAKKEELQKAKDAVKDVKRKIREAKREARETEITVGRAKREEEREAKRKVKIAELDVKKAKKEEAKKIEEKEIEKKEKEASDFLAQYYEVTGAMAASGLSRPTVLKLLDKSLSKWGEGYIPLKIGEKIISMKYRKGSIILKTWFDKEYGLVK